MENRSDKVVVHFPEDLSTYTEDQWKTRVRFLLPELYQGIARKVKPEKRVKRKGVTLLHYPALSGQQIYVMPTRNAEGHYTGFVTWIEGTPKSRSGPVP